METTYIIDLASYGHSSVGCYAPYEMTLVSLISKFKVSESGTRVLKYGLVGLLT